MTACRQITCTIPWLPCEQLPYPPEYPRISRMQQRDKSDLPLPVLFYKYFLLGYSFSILSFYSSKSTFLAAASLENLKNFCKSLFHQSSKSLILFFLRENGRQLRRSWGQFTTLFFLYFCCTPVHPQFFYWILLFPFVLLFILKNFLGFGR